MIVLALLLSLFFCSPAFGQPPEVPEEQTPHVIQSGETLWDLSGEYFKDPTVWEKFKDLNPYLKEPGRIYPRGEKIIAKIFPGEVLWATEEMKKHLRLLPGSEVTALLGPQPTMAPQSSFSLWQLLTSPLPWWLWLLLGIVMVSLLYALYRRFFSNPATAGEPVVQGGISPNRSQDLENQFQRIAERHWGERNPSANLAVERPVRVGEIEEGTLSGWGTIQYRDRTETRHLHNEPGYKARFRFADGHEEDIFFLQRCANDVTYAGTRYLGFTFRPGRTVVAAPSPTSSAQPGPNGEMRLTTVHLEGLTIILPEGSDVRLKDGDITLFLGRSCEVVIKKEEDAEQPSPQPQPASQQPSKPAH